MTVKLSELVKHFDFEIINKSKDYNKKEIKGSHVSSGSYEFLGKINHKSNHIVGFGTKESKVFSTLSKKELSDGFANLSKSEIPAVIISKSFEILPVVKELIKKNDLTLLRKDLSKAEIHTIVGSYLVKELSAKETHHASLISVYGLGVMIIGKSGVGKSEVTLDLINRGHFFVADDAIDTVQFAGELLGKSNEVLKDHLEVRGIGILDIKLMYGIHKIMDETKIDLVIELNDDIKQKPNQERLGNKYSNIFLNGVTLPKIIINTTTSKNLPQLVEAATINMKLKMEGTNVSENFIDRVNKNLKK